MITPMPILTQPSGGGSKSSWSNNEIGDNFAAQTIDLDLSNSSQVAIMLKAAKTAASYGNGVVSVGSSGNVSVTHNGTTYTRTFTVTTSGVQISAETHGYNSTAIPIVIGGIADA